MLLDFTSLLLAAGLSGICLSLTMFALWLSSRDENFLLSWGLGVLLLVGHVFSYWLYVKDPHPSTGMLVVTLLPLGFALIYAATYQFFSGRSPMTRAVTASSISLALVVPPMVAGYDGVSLIAQNFCSAALLCTSAVIYWRNRSEALAAISTLAILYIICGLSFAACGMVILWNGQWVIGHAPDNWAERVNIVVSVSCLSAAGALSLALNQMRLAHRHKADSLTDPLTGLLNRRALFSLYEHRPFAPNMAIAMFDLDNFKPVNDVYGHSVGDEVIMRFASVLSSHRRSRDDAVRLGGEEFALVMKRVNQEQAQDIAERIASAFAEERVRTLTGPLRCTVSAGIGFGHGNGASLEEVLERADRALYAAKRGGRNRVEFDRLRLAS